jgi:hypothetical protein
LRGNPEIIGQGMAGHCFLLTAGMNSHALATRCHTTSGTNEEVHAW